MCLRVVRKWQPNTARLDTASPYSLVDLVLADKRYVRYSQDYQYSQESQETIQKIRDILGQCFFYLFGSRHPLRLKKFGGTLTLQKGVSVAPYVVIE